MNIFFNLLIMIYTDMLFTKKNDVSMESLYLIFLFHNGFQSVFLYRISNFFYINNFMYIGLIIWRLNLFLTGADIHPSSIISSPIMIDHGVGVVIGETAIIGKGCVLHQCVTLGGIVGRNKGSRRHPILEDSVYVGAGAKILGPLTVKSNTKIGANCVLLKDTIDRCTVVGVPGKLIMSSNKENKKFDCIYCN